MSLHPAGESCSDIGRLLALNDPPAWLELLMRDDDTNLRLTALRLLEVRKAYAGGGR